MIDQFTFKVSKAREYLKNLPIKHLQYAKSYAFFIWICESINGLTFKVSMFENRGIFEKFSNEKSLQDSRNRIFRIVRYRRIFSESESGIRTTLPDRRQYVYFSPTPINLISFLGSVFLGSGVSYLFFHPLCARVGCTHRIRVTGLYVETFHPREVRGGGGEIDFPFIRGNVGYVARTRDESLRLPQRKSLSTSTRAES